MDPIANLKEQLELAARIVGSDMGNAWDEADADRLAELVLALNKWISNGGFLPTAWTDKSNGYPRYYVVCQLGSDSQLVFVSHGGFDTPAQALDYIRTCHLTIQETARILRAAKPVRAVYANG